MEPRSLGRLIIIAGVCIVVVGVLVSSGGLSWFGHLPGDLRFGGERVRVYVPIVSMLLISLALSLLLYLLRRFL